MLDESYGTVMKDNSVDNIYRAIEEVVSNTGLREKGQELCYNRLKDHFTWKHTTDNLERIIEK